MRDSEYARQHAAEQFEITLSALKRHLDREEYEKALPLCTKALEVDPDCVLVRRCRVFALLNCNRWQDALQACKKFETEEESFAFEKAYCHYRLNEFQKALDVIEKPDQEEGDVDRLKLEAQVRYRMGDYGACAEIYERLYDEDADDSGLLVNAMASRVSGDEPQKAIGLVADAEELLESSYELCFNLACAHLDENRLGEAEKRLLEAKQICITELTGVEEESTTDVENHEELAAIHVQQALVLQRKGSEKDKDEADALYKKVLRQRVKKDKVDVTILAVACNNVVALRPEGKSLLDSLKRINVASKESLEHKLTTKQTVEIAMNKCLLLLKAKKRQDALSELQKLKDAYPSHPRVAMIEGLIAERDKGRKEKGSGCEAVLTAYLEEHPDCEEVLLCLAQLHVECGKYDKAIETLARLPIDGRAQPRTLEALVSLHQRQKSPEKVVKCLKAAIEYWSSQQDAKMEDNLAAVLRLSARLAVQLDDRAFAAEAFRLFLEKVDGSDTEALCGLVQASASTDVEQAEEYAQRLRVPEYGHLDPEELELGAIPKVASIKKAQGGQVVEEALQEAKKKRKRGKKKPRYPKGFDPAHPGPPPDPERWLPKTQRAEYLKKMEKMGKKNKGMIRFTQGSMPADDEAFRKKGPSTAQVEVSKDGSTGRPRNKTKKAGKK